MEADKGWDAFSDSQSFLQFLLRAGVHLFTIITGYGKNSPNVFTKFRAFCISLFVVGYEKNDQGHSHRCGTSKREHIGSVQSSLLSAGTWGRLSDYWILVVTSIWVGLQVLYEDFPTIGWVSMYLLKTQRVFGYLAFIDCYTSTFLNMKNMDSKYLDSKWRGLERHIFSFCEEPQFTSQVSQCINSDTICPGTYIWQTACDQKQSCDPKKVHLHPQARPIFGIFQPRVWPQLLISIHGVKIWDTYSTWFGASAHMIAIVKGQRYIIATTFPICFYCHNICNIL